MKPRFFSTPAQFSSWLEKNHAKATELWVGFYKKNSGKPSITWPESVDQPLCFGSIDGIRKRIDDTSYQIRFTPRRHGSSYRKMIGWWIVSARKEETRMARLARLISKSAKGKRLL